MTTVIFSHGQESGPWGTKIRAMAEVAEDMGCSIGSVDYQGIADPTERVHRLILECRDIDGPLILVGSSMGGHVATAAAAELGAAGLFVLAPAYYMPGYEELTPAPPNLPIAIVHGWRDDVVKTAYALPVSAMLSCTCSTVTIDSPIISTRSTIIWADLLKKSARRRRSFRTRK